MIGLWVSVRSAGGGKIQFNFHLTFSKLINFGFLSAEVNPHTLSNSGYGKQSQMRNILLVDGNPEDFLFLEPITDEH